MKPIRLSIAAIIIFIAGFLAGQSILPVTKTPTTTSTQQSQQQVFVSVEQTPSTIVFAAQTVQKGQNLLDITKQFALEHQLTFETKDYGDLGTLVTQIGDKKNGDSNNYWQYWVNKKQVQVAANIYQVQPNDVIEWKFTSSEF